MKALNKILKTSLCFRSVVFVLQSNDRVYFWKKFIDLLIDVFDILSVSFVLPFFVGFFIGLLVLGTQLPVDLSLFSTFLLAENFFNWWNCSWDSFSVLKNTIKFLVGRKFLVGLSRILHIHVSLNFLFWNLFQLGAKLFDFIFNFFEKSYFIIFVLLWLLWENRLNSFVKLIDNNRNFLFIQCISILHKLNLNVK